MNTSIFPSHFAEIVFYIFFYAFIALEGYIVLKRNKNARNEDQGSQRVMGFVLLIAFMTMNFVLHSTVGLLPAKYHWMTWCGMLVMLVGIVFRWYSIRILGKFFTGQVQIHRDHKLIQVGPYRIIRHPSYTGGLIAFIGIALCTNDWLAYIVLTAAPMIAYAIRIPVEEKALEKHFGDEYRAYRERTWRLIPYLF